MKKNEIGLLFIDPKKIENSFEYKINKIDENFLTIRDLHDRILNKYKKKIKFTSFYGKNIDSEEYILIAKLLQPFYITLINETFQIQIIFLNLDERKIIEMNVK